MSDFPIAREGEVLVLLTGGTIGSRRGEAGACPDRDVSVTLRRLVEAGTRVVQYGYAGADGADVAEVVDAHREARVLHGEDGYTSVQAFWDALESRLEAAEDDEASSELLSELYDWGDHLANLGQ